MVNSNQAIVLFPNSLKHQSQVFHRSPPTSQAIRKIAQKTLQTLKFCVSMKQSTEGIQKCKHEEKYNEIQRSIFLSFTRVHIYVYTYICSAVYMQGVTQTKQCNLKKRLREQMLECGLEGNRLQQRSAGSQCRVHCAEFTENSSQSRVHRVEFTDSQ